MTDSRRNKLADILVNYCVSVQPGEWVVISGSTVALPLINDLVERVLLAGGNPTAILNSGDLEETKFLFANEKQLEWVSPLSKQVTEKADAIISVWATENLKNMNGIDPERMRIHQAAMQEINSLSSKRMAEGKLKWVGTQFPCSAYAQEADMSLRDFENFVYKATLVERENPIKEWQEIKQRQQGLVKWMKGKNELVIQSPFVDLTLSIKERIFINDGGEQNMPGGEIYTSPVEDSANGWIEFTYPAIMGGREVDGIRLEFLNGKVVKASAEKNEAYLLQMLEMDAGARFLGEFAIGTNYGITKFTKSLLYDEKIGGTIHLALGRGFPKAGSKNQSSLHWDMICNMYEDSQIRVDGELFYKDGQFVL